MRNQVRREAEDTSSTKAMMRAAKDDLTLGVVFSVRPSCVSSGESTRLIAASRCGSATVASGMQMQEHAVVVHSVQMAYW